jgi:hypothetical protein
MREMCTSMLRSKASSGWPLSASMIWSRLSTRPAARASTTSSSNWWLVRSQGRPASRAWPRTQVDHQAAELQHVVGAGVGRGAAQQRLDARQQLARLEGLGQVVVGADLQAEDAVHRLAAGAEHQQRQAARARLGAQLRARGPVPSPSGSMRSSTRASKASRRSSSRPARSEPAPSTAKPWLRR